MSASPMEILSAVLFALAIVHTFATRLFEHLAHTRPKHAGLWHLLGEIEVVFGFWALILVLGMFLIQGAEPAVAYMDSRNFTEPMFVFAIMVIAATRPVLYAASQFINLIARGLPFSPLVSVFFTLLAVVPLLGSLITEPAAMTLAALMLRDRIYDHPISARLKYATLGVLFVNISIGGTLTSFAAPPVLMVAGAWDWDIRFMLTHFGWKAALAVFINAALVSLFFAKELRGLPRVAKSKSEAPVPVSLVIVHLCFLVGVVTWAHHPAIFMGLFLFFLGVASAYQHYQDRLILREGLLVAFFLAGLVVLGGMQQWWLQPILMGMNRSSVFWGTAALTAFTDNAALTYLGSLVEGLPVDFQYALVAGAVTGGGLTIIANAPNPAGIAILRGAFEENAVKPMGLFLAALPPTLVAAAAFLCFS